LTPSKIAGGLDGSVGGGSKSRNKSRRRDDDNDSNASSELSVHENDDATNARVVKYTPSTSHTAYRLEQQQETYENALDEIIGFIEDYPINLDIIHAIQAAKQKRLLDQVPSSAVHLFPRCVRARVSLLFYGVSVSSFVAVQYEWLKDVMKRPEAKFALHMVKVRVCPHYFPFPSILPISVLSYIALHCRCPGGGCVALHAARDGGV
jgi:hypothetical protein